MPSSPEHSDLTGAVIGAAYEVYNELGYGFLESVYERALIIVLQGRGIEAVQQSSIEVFFRGENIGHFVADLVVEGQVIVELKSVRQLATSHEVQLVNYLVATRMPIGLLLNFGPEGVEVKRKHREYSASTGQSIL